jgi:hypothetical protein
MAESPIQSTIRGNVPTSSSNMGSVITAAEPVRTSAIQKRISELEAENKAQRDDIQSCKLKYMPCDQ